MLSNKEIGKRVRELRVSLGLSQQELADRAGFASKASISRIENAQRDMTTSDVVLVAKALRTTVNNLLGWDDGLKTDVHTYVLNPTLASAGSSSYNDGYSEALEIEVPDALLGKYAGRKDLQFIKVTGESMNNVIKPDSIVAYTTEPSLTNLNGGDIVLYRYQSEQGIKRFYDIGDSVLFRPDSNMSGFKEQRFLKDEYLEIIGKVVIYSVFM